MKIEINNRQKTLKISPRRIAKLTEFFMRRAGKLAPGRKWNEISVVLADDSGIAAVNARHLNRNRPTDVISFCFPPMPGEKDLFSAEILLNVQRAAKVKISAGNWNPSKELALYLAHGCDHAVDQEDRTPRERHRMRRRELRWLHEAGENNLIERLLILN